LSSFYFVLVILCPASMYGPALKALLAKNAGPDEQGALQGSSFVLNLIIKDSSYNV